MILANSLETVGEQAGDNDALSEAIDLYNGGFTGFTRQQYPLDWAMTQTNLGVALMRLGERESGTQHLTEAVAAYRAALEEYTQARVPLDWATTQNNLGLALTDLGERMHDTDALCEALRDHVSAWQVSSEAAPHYASIAVAARKQSWRQSTINLGELLRSVCEPIRQISIRWVSRINSPSVPATARGRVSFAMLQHLPTSVTAPAVSGVWNRENLSLKWWVREGEIGTLGS